MQYRAVLVLTVVLASCSTDPVTRLESRAVNPTEATAPEQLRPSVDSVLEVLLTAASTDFHAHHPPEPVGFRNVRLGHVNVPGGEARYMLCGQFLPAQKEGTAEWIAFVTIKTSGYEQLLGGMAEHYCRDSSVVWEKVSDLSSLLQSRFDALR